jgi:hypothetical protein
MPHMHSARCNTVTVTANRVHGECCRTVTDISVMVTRAMTLQGLCALQEPLSGIPLAAKILSPPPPKRSGG